MNRRNNDILWKGMLEEVFEVYQKDGSEEWVLCHVEVQGKDDPLFAKRMFKYYCRIFDRYDRPMTAIAIYTGRDGKKLPGMYLRRYAGAELTYKYNTLCILDYEDRGLVVLAAKKALLKERNLEEVLLNENFFIAKLLIKRRYSIGKTNAILSFLHNYVRFEKPETNCIFEIELDHLTGKKNTMGIIEQVKQMKLEEARREGEEKRNRFFVENLLLSTDFSIKKIASLAGVSTTFVNRIKTDLKAK